MIPKICFPTSNGTGKGGKEGNEGIEAPLGFGLPGKFQRKDSGRNRLRSRGKKTSKEWRLPPD